MDPRRIADKDAGFADLLKQMHWNCVVLIEVAIKSNAFAWIWSDLLDVDTELIRKAPVFPLYAVFSLDNAVINWMSRAKDAGFRIDLAWFIHKLNDFMNIWLVNAV